MLRLLPVGVLEAGRHYHNLVGRLQERIRSVFLR